MNRFPPMKKLAIVIPYYKIDFFEDTIKSVAAQNDKNFKLYIGNDASPDDPLPVISKYLREGEYQYIKYSENVGGENLALQWERILTHVKEEWFQILGDDDMIEKNFVEEFYKILPAVEANKITAIKFVHEWIDEDNHHLKKFNYDTDTLNAVEFIIKKYNGDAISSLSENIFKTELYRRYGFEKIPLAWGSDDIALLTFSGYRNIFYSQASKVQVRISESSISGSEAMDVQKSMALNNFREKIITRHSGHFHRDFIEKVILDYLTFCHLRRKKSSYRIALYYLKQMRMEKFLKTMKKVYYLNKMHGS